MEALTDQGLFEEAERLELEVFEAPIDSKETYDNYADYLRRAKNTLKLLDAKRDEEGRPYLEAHKAIQAKYKPYLEKLKQTISTIDRAMVKWVQEQERIREEERRRLEAKARAEEERKRRELEERARKHEEAGRIAKAEILREEADQVIVPIPVIDEVKQPEGTHLRSVWKGRVVDVKKIPHEYLLAFSEVVQGKLDKFAQSTRGTIGIEGIDFYEEKSLITRR